MRRDVLAMTLAPDVCEMAPIALTLIPPERLRESPQRGTRLVETWPGFVRWLSRPVTASDNASAGGFALADLGDGIRRTSHVITVSALSVDYDAAVVPLRASQIPRVEARADALLTRAGLRLVNGGITR
jgi:hypothetical protein